MTRRRMMPGGAALLVAAAAAGCGDSARAPSEPEYLSVPVTSQGAANADGPRGTHMHGGEETPPRPSLAQGELTLWLGSDGTTLRYKLRVANIVDLTMAHIHLAPPGEPGPAVVWLYPSAPPAQLVPGRFDGVLAEGVLDDADVVGPLAGQGITALVAAIREGNAYANVHTVEFPPGEIRGQVR